MGQGGGGGGSRGRGRLPPSQFSREIATRLSLIGQNTIKGNAGKNVLEKGVCVCGGAYM